jgi:glycosyltransferase involved in cell wall biosynthesis
MREVMPMINKKLVDRILVVDGGSTDGTVEYMDKQGIEYFIQKEKGTGTAFCESLARINTDYVIVFSPDGNSMPEKIFELTRIIPYYDIVTVSRYKDDAQSYDDDMVTRFGNWMFTEFFNLLYGTNLTDVLVMYRAYNVKNLKALNPTPDSDAFGTQVLARAVKQGYRISELPGDEPKRIGGVRKMNPLKNGWMELCMMIKERIKK